MSDPFYGMTDAQIAASIEHALQDIADFGMVEDIDFVEAARSELDRRAKLFGTGDAP